MKKIVSTTLDMEMTEPIEPKLRQVFQFIENYRESIQNAQTRGRKIDVDFICARMPQNQRFAACQVVTWPSS